jgi:hypothetical protein
MWAIDYGEGASSHRKEENILVLKMRILVNQVLALSHPPITYFI